MAGRFSGSAEVDRPIEEVFDYLADGTHDPDFSPRVVSIRREPQTAPGVGTVFVSTVKDAGMTTSRRFELTKFDRPTAIGWTERSKNMVVVPDGGYDLEDLVGNRTRVTIFNTLQGHGLGKVFAGFALKAAVKDADALAARIKAAIEAS